MSATHVSQLKEPNIQHTVSGEEHGLIKVLSNSVPDNEFKRFAEKNRETMKKQKAEDGRLVRHLYINTKDASKRLERTYCFWDGDPLLAYKLIHDHEYDLPMGFVNQITNQKRTKRSGLLDSKSQPIMKDEIVNSEHRFVKVG